MKKYKVYKAKKSPLVTSRVDRFGKGIHGAVTKFIDTKPKRKR